MLSGPRTTSGGPIWTEMLGVAVGTCKSQLHRARRLLGEQLAAQEVTR